MDEKNLQDKFYDTPYGRKILKCIQCGTCSASCPLTGLMEHGPREIFALIRDGEMEPALRSETPWYCVSCYQCVARCPQEIPVIDLMYCLKRMSMEYDLVPDSHKIPDLYRAFSQAVDHHGRISEAMVMANYGILHPLDALKNISVALKLLKRKRLEILPQQIIGCRWVAQLPDSEKVRKNIK
jgi:heterodisulfide reductase subunit C